MADSSNKGARKLSPLRRALPGRKVDDEGELLRVPLPLTFVWLVLGVLTVLEAANDIFGVAGPDWLYDNWVHNAILGVCAALVLARAVFEPVARKAWLAFGTGLLLWFIGSAAWAVFYSGSANAPYPSFADAFWLAWYPLMAIGIFYLILVRVPLFELHRWMDGIAVMLLVLAVGFALVIQPAAAHKTVGALATFVAFLYPVLDVLLIGAILGVYGLLGWRPDTMWVLIGLAVVSSSVADAVFAVQEAEARAVVSGDSYDFIWTAGALALALAAGPGPRRPTTARGGHRDACGGAGSLRAGPGHRHSDLRDIQGSREERANRHHRGARRGFRADHSDPTTAKGPGTRTRETSPSRSMITRDPEPAALPDRHALTRLVTCSTP